MVFPSDAKEPYDHFSERWHCPLCSSTALTPLLHRHGVPMLANQLMETPEAARQVQRGTIHLVICDCCGFIFNSAFETATLYHQRYDNSQAYAPAFEAYLDELVLSLVREYALQQSCIIEVGCGDGLFLRKLIEASPGTIGYGFDPSYRGPTSVLDGRVHFVARYYDETARDLGAHVLICRHVIEHIPKPLPFLRLLHRTLACSSEARVFFETPTIDWILQNKVMWDMYYEHCSYFNAETLTYALELSGFNVETIKRTFNNQYLWVEASVAHTAHILPMTGGGARSLSSLASQFQQEEERFCTAWKQTIQGLRHSGPIALLGAAGKGVTLANLIDPEAQLIACIVDLNPQKQQKFLPGTGHPIISYEEMNAYGIASAVLLNPNYYEDTVRLVALHQRSIKLIVDVPAASKPVAASVSDKEARLNALAERLERARLEGKTMVFTNGIFDLLHMGHVQFLQYAKTLGDILVVAIDSDASTRRFKGQGGPLFLNKIA